jgi:hypothetical protein
LGKNALSNAATIESSFGFEALKNTFRAMLDGARQFTNRTGQDTSGKGDT